MWKISDRTWINPLAIAYIEDGEAAGGKPVLTVNFLGPNGEHLWNHLALYDQERQVLLAYLAQHSVMHPPYMVRDDSDEPPF